MTPLIDIQNLTLNYGRKKVLKNISFSLDGGKIYGLLGRNGAGKTSLLSLLASFQRPKSGMIKIHGEEPFENARIMQNVGLFYNQDYAGETDSVKEMLEFVQRYRPNFDIDYAQYLVERFDLPMKTAISKLSTGKKSALNATIGLASRTPITLFDEVYLGMDAPSREFFYKEIFEDQERVPRTFILSTHLVSEMDYLFDEVLIIHRGELLLHEDYETVISRGAAITGEATKVDRFTQGMTILNEKTLGPTKSVMVYGQLSETELEELRISGLDIGPVPLQDLFIHLTGGGKIDE